MAVHVRRLRLPARCAHRRHKVCTVQTRHPRWGQSTAILGGRLGDSGMDRRAVFVRPRGKCAFLRRAHDCTGSLTEHRKRLKQREQRRTPCGGVRLARKQRPGSVSCRGAAGPSSCAAKDPATLHEQPGRFHERRQPTAGRYVVNKKGTLIASLPQPLPGRSCAQTRI